MSHLSFRQYRLCRSRPSVRLQLVKPRETVIHTHAHCSDTDIRETDTDRTADTNTLRQLHRVPDRPDRDRSCRWRLARRTRTPAPASQNRGEYRSRRAGGTPVDSSNVSGDEGCYRTDIGYHEGIVHVGVLTASPDAFVLWQEVGLSAVLTVTVVVVAVAGGVVVSLLNRSNRTKTPPRQ